MRINEVIDDNEEQYTSINDLENVLDVYVDNNGKCFFNLNTTLYLEVSSDVLDEFIVFKDMPWTIVSYNIYKTTRFAWLLFKLNNVPLADQMKIVPAQSRVKYLQTEYIEQMTERMNSY